MTAEVLPQTPESLIQELHQLLLDYRRRYPDEAEIVARFQAFAASGEPLQGKQNLQRHLTASAWILNSNQTAVLLVYHKKLQKWLQPGGHTDVGEAWWATADREAREETGLTRLRPLSRQLFDLDIHAIPARPDQAAHEHYDLRFLFQADDAEPLVLSDESSDLRWVARSELIAFTTEESQAQMERKVAQGWG